MRINGARSAALVLAGAFGGIALVLSCGTGPSRAKAQDDGGTSCGGTCMVSGPIQIAGPTRVITADTDSAQLASGVVMTTGVVVQGPFVLTDLASAAGGGSVTIAVGVGTACPLSGGSQHVFPSSMFGGRLLVPAGAVACYDANNGTVSWAGFKPY